MLFRFTMLALALVFSSSPVLAQFNIENAFPNLGFNRPVDLQNAGDGSNRLFVLEQEGQIIVFDNNAIISTSSVFLDIRALVNDAGNEEGLLGLAFHPAYASNGYFYVNYTAANPRRTVIARYSVSSNDPDKADESSGIVVLTIAQPFSNHNGGQIAFGPDGYLYIGTGDGGSGGDPQNNGQNRASLLGKILRIDVDLASAGREYSIPQGNPFAGTFENWAEEIYAWGMRNPWRFSFDPVTGRLWTGDVGQNKFEEVDIIENGGNYGWRVMEGFACYNPASGCDTTGLTLPVHEYGRDQGSSITGGYVYRGGSVPEIEGKYIFADFVSGRIWGLSYNGPGNVSNQLLLASGQNISSFGVDEKSELYICTFSGSIFRFTPTIISATEEGIMLPSEISLANSYPNPALLSTTSTVTLRFSLPQVSHVRLVLHDALGREIRTFAEEKFRAGTHRVAATISDLSPGIYYYSLYALNTRLTRKLLVLE